MDTEAQQLDDADVAFSENGHDEADDPFRTLRRSEPARDVVQEALFDIEPNWREHWWGMPAFEQKDCMPSHRIIVNFLSWDDLQDFANRLGISVTRRTDSLWWPGEQLDRPSEWVYDG